MVHYSDWGVAVVISFTSARQQLEPKLLRSRQADGSGDLINSLLRFIKAQRQNGLREKLGIHIRRIDDTDVKNSQHFGELLGRNYDYSSDDREQIAQLVRIMDETEYLRLIEWLKNQ